MRDHAAAVDSLIAEATEASKRLEDENAYSIKLVLLIAGSGMLIGLSVALWIGVRGLSRPISELKTVMEAFAKDDLTAEVPGTARRDELGEMARTVKIASPDERSRRSADAGRSARRPKRTPLPGANPELLQLASDFESAVGEIVDNASAEAA